MSLTRSLAQHAWLVPGGVVVFAPLLRALAPPGVTSPGFSTAQFLAFEVCLALVAVFARHVSRASARRNRIGAALLALAAAGAGAWVVWFLGTDRAVFLPRSADVVGVACFLIGAVLVAGLLSGGRQIVYIAALVVVLGFLGPRIGADASAPAVPAASYATYLVYGSEGLLGRALDIMVNPVLAFVVFGAFFEASGGGRALSQVALKVAQRSRSGAIKACILASGMFGAVSGTAISNVMTTGAFSIPSMRRIGVRNETAAGIEAAASTSGQIMPPVMGAAAFLLADFVGETYAKVAFASLLPALGVYLAMFRQADLVAFAVDPTPTHTTVRVPVSFALHLAGPAALVVALAAMDMQADRAAMVGAVTCAVVSLVLVGWRESLAQFRAGFERLVSTGLQLVIIAGAMGLLLGVLNATGVAVAAAVTLADIGQHSLALALAVAGACAFVLGAGMATVGVYILAGAMLAPGLIEAGVPPLAAHLFVLYCGILSMLTPPVALASLAASALAKADFTQTAWAALRFGWILFVMPFIIVVQPGLVLLGGWQAVGQGVVVTFVFILTATAPGLKPGLRTGLAALAAVAVFWRGPDWVALVGALAIAGFLLARARMGHR